LLRRNESPDPGLDWVKLSPASRFARPLISVRSSFNSGHEIDQVAEWRLVPIPDFPLEPGTGSNHSPLGSMQGDCAALLCWRVPRSATTFLLTWTRRPAHHPRHENRLPRSARRIDGK